MSTQSITLVKKPMTKAQDEQLKQALWALLEKQAAKQTQGDRDSIPAEEAEGLFDSICYTLRFYLNGTGLGDSLLVQGCLDGLFEKAQQYLFTALCSAQKLYQLARDTAVPFANRAYRDTLLGIGTFFARYDHRLAAHETPGDIDYQLCLPVPEGLRGLDYVAEYLKRFVAESLFLGRFSPSRAKALIDSDCVDAEGLLINLYEPVLQNAVGLMLLGEDPRGLSIEAHQRGLLERQLLGIPKLQVEAALDEGAQRLITQMGMDSKAAASPEAAYLREAARSLAPRIASVRGLEHIFVTIR